MLAADAVPRLCGTRRSVPHARMSITASEPARTSARLHDPRPSLPSLSSCHPGMSDAGRRSYSRS